MADVFSKKKRSEIMRKVKSSGNKSTEILLLKIFKANKISGWRRNYAIKSKPDFVFLSKKIAVFTDGCFWHGHNCRNLTPSQNKAYWKRKRLKNIERDKKNSLALINRGWKVVRFWECDIKKSKIDLSVFK